MKSHPLHDILIQYQFDLLDEAQRDEVSAHLEDCGQCRDKLEQIRRQFSTLDVLNDEASVSDELIQKTIASLHQPKASRPVSKMVWIWPIAIAAGVVLAAGVVFVGQSYWNTPTQKGTEKPLAQDVKTPAQTALTDSISAKSQTLLGVVSADKVRIVPKDQIPDKPPFVPASAIELVVLPSPDKMQVTIYNSADLTLVRDTRKLTLKAGWNWLQFMWAETQIDPTSLSLRPLEYADKVDVQQLVYPARLKDIGRWLIRSEVEGSVPFEITYFTSGLTWKAFYEGTISPDEKTMQLKSYVRVANNSGQDYENAQTRLIVGKVHLLDQITTLARQKYPYGPQVDENGIFRFGRGLSLFHDDALKTINGNRDKLYFEDRSGGMGGGMAGGYDIKDIAKEGLSEYFLYTIEGTEDLPNTWAKRLPSLEASDIPIKSLYKYDEDRYSTQTIRFVSFTNDTEHNLGSTPLPDGNVKLYRQLNAEQNLSYVGAAGIKYIPVNEAVELNLDTDPLVKVEPLLTDSRTENYMFNDKGDITGWDEIETWKIKLTNTRDIPADFEVTRKFNTDSWDLKVIDVQAVEYKKHDAQHARFTTTLAGQTQKDFSYSVTKRQGIRKEQIIVEKEKTVVDGIQDISLEDKLPWNSKNKPVVYIMTEQDKALESQLEQKATLTLAEEMEFIDCINKISRAVEPHLPIMVAVKDVAENVFVQLDTSVRLNPAEFSDITIASALTKILRSVSQETMSNITYNIRDGVVWIGSSSLIEEFRSYPDVDVTSRLNLKKSDILNAQLKKQITVNFFQEDMTFADAVQSLRMAVDPPLPITVMMGDFNENMFVQPGTPLGCLSTEPISASVETVLGIILRLMASHERPCFLVDEDVIVVAVRSDRVMGHYYRDTTREVNLYSDMDPQVRTVLDKKIDISGLAQGSALKDAFDIFSRAASPSLKIDVKWDDLSENAFIQPDAAIRIDGISTIKSISLTQAIRLLLYDTICGSLSGINCKVENDTLTIASRDFFESTSGDMDNSDTEQ
jgi:hypothetical protein